MSELKHQRLKKLYEFIDANSFSESCFPSLYAKLLEEISIEEHSDNSIGDTYLSNLKQSRDKEAWHYKTQREKYKSKNLINEFKDFVRNFRSDINGAITMIELGQREP